MWRVAHACNLLVTHVVPESCHSGFAEKGKPAHPHPRETRLKARQTEMTPIIKVVQIFPSIKMRGKTGRMGCSEYRVVVVTSRDIRYISITEELCPPSSRRCGI